MITSTKHAHKVLAVLLILVTFISLISFYTSKTFAHNDTGWPGSGYWYHVRNDENLHAKTLQFPDNSASYLVCDFTLQEDVLITQRKYIIHFGWSNKWTWDQFVVDTTYLIVLSDDQPCVARRIYHTGPINDVYEPDVKVIDRLQENTFSFVFIPVITR